MLTPDNLSRLLKATPLFILILSGIIWFTSENQNQTLSSNTPEEKQAPDITLINTQTTHYDASGTPQYKLSAERLEHFKDSEVVHLASPKLQANQQNDLWQVTSKNGLADLKSDKITLSNQVIIDRQSKLQPLRITTSTVTIQTKEKTVENDVLTELTSSNSQITTQGFHTNLNTGETLLKAKVRGTHVIQE
jgi:LPS export ABC transporter protein LptC